MEVEPQKKGWSPHIPEIVSATANVVYLLYAVGSRLDPYFLVTIGVILYGILIGTILYRKWAEDRHQLAVLKIKSEEIKNKQWLDSTERTTSQAGREGMGRIERERVYQGIISSLQTASKDTSLSAQDQTVYADIIKRIQYMHSGSLF